MTITWQTYCIVLPLVFIAAVVDAIGGGGGLISVPGYTLAGLPYGMASGCNKFTSTFGAVAATIRFARRKKIRWLPAICAMAGSIPASFLGTWVSILLGNDFMKIFMICATPVVGVFLVLRRNVEPRELPLTKFRLFLCFLTGVLTGFYDGLFGPGTGTFLILLLCACTGMDMVSASATAKPVNLASNFISLVTRIAAGQVLFMLTVPGVVLSITGGLLGSRLALTKGARFIRYIMLGVMGLLILKIAYDLITAAN